MTHSIPDSSAVALGTDLGTVLITGDYKFDQTPVDGAARGRLAPGASSAARACCCCAATRPTSTATASRPRSRSSGPHLEEVFARCEGRIVVTSFASNIHRVQQVVDAAAALDRKVSLVGRSMRKNVGIGRTLGHIEVPDGLLVGPREIEDFPDERMVIISTGSQGEPLSALRRMAYRDHPQVQLHERRHGRLLGDAGPRQRARGQRDDRPPLPHRLRRDHAPRRARARLRARLRGGGQADAEPRQAALRDAVPRRLQAAAPARPAGRGGRRRAGGHLPGRATGCRWTSTSAARASASPSRPA